MTNIIIILDFWNISSGSIARAVTNVDDLIPSYTSHWRKQLGELYISLQSKGVWVWTLFNLKTAFLLSGAGCQFTPSNWLSVIINCGSSHHQLNVSQLVGNSWLQSDCWYQQCVLYDTLTERASGVCSADFNSYMQGVAQYSIDTQSQTYTDRPIMFNEKRGCWGRLM